MALTICLQRSLTFSANPSFVLSSASTQLSLIPLCTLFPPNISRFHAYTRRHNRCVIVYPFAARDQGWDLIHRGTLASSAPGAVWEHSGKLDEKLDPKRHCWIPRTGPSAADRQTTLSKGVSDSCRQTHVATLQTLPRGWAWCGDDWCKCVSEACLSYDGMSKNFYLSTSQVLWINTSTEDQQWREEAVKENMKFIGVRG